MHSEIRDVDIASLLFHRRSEMRRISGAVFILCERQDDVQKRGAEKDNGYRFYGFMRLYDFYGP